MKDFKDKVVVITGGATGIGFGFAKLFGKEGAKVLIASRRHEKIEAAVKVLIEMGYDAAGTTCDVSDYAQVEALLKFTLETYGTVDVIINNAGIGGAGAPVLQLDYEWFTRVMDINYYGVLNGIKVFGEYFMERGKAAAIYTVGSENSLFNGVPMASAYLASKQAVRALMEALNDEAPEFIDVALITPGLVEAEITAGMPNAMPADKFAGIIMEQLKAGNFYGVSHSYAMTHIQARHDKLKAAFEKYAPRHEGDIKGDAYTNILQMMQSMQGSQAEVLTAENFSAKK